MTLQSTGFDGLFIIEPTVYQDERGYFFESYNKKLHQQQGLDHDFVQDNQSRSGYGVVRGLHFQTGPHAQTKLVRVLEGTIYDVAVDLRAVSPTFGKWFGLEISAQNRLQLLIPKGFGHGFSVLSESATVFYKCDQYYHPGSEKGIRFDDPVLNIDWKIKKVDMVVSGKDKKLPDFSNYREDFV